MESNQNNENKGTGHSFAFEIIQYITKDNSRLCKIVTIEAVAILILLAILLFKVL